MPGPVSDTYDPEFSTGANARLVRDAMASEVRRLSMTLKARMNILQVVEAKPGPKIPLQLPERSWRIIRFALERAMETV